VFSSYHVYIQEATDLPQSALISDCDAQKETEGVLQKKPASDPDRALFCVNHWPWNWNRD
jgi:hypothetical protein